MNKYQIGMVGLGVMGRNLVLNMADHGTSVIGYDKDLEKTRRLEDEAQNMEVGGAENLDEFVAALRKPRSVMMMVPAGTPVEAVIESLLPRLEENDLLIDGGNSFYQDTNKRAQKLAEKGIHYLGAGISGGESGARYGPSIMPGGHQQAYQRVQAIFEAIAANVNGEPCVAYLGPGSAGHYVKMVHNGIEYGIMQIIAETYDLLKRGLNMSNDELHLQFEEWNRKELNSFLIEISAAIFSKPDEKTGRQLIDVILDEARQKGTGMWASQDAMELRVPVPTLDVAVAMRNLSAMKIERRTANHLLGGTAGIYTDDRQKFIEQLKGSLYAGMIITYAQGFSLLFNASRSYEYHLDLEKVSRIWRGGCIIRSALLEDFRSAFQKDKNLPNLLLDADLGRQVLERRGDMLEVVHAAAETGIPAPGLMASLAYLDAYRSEWLPANLIQAQRDYFGSHTYQRVDEKGSFHTQWEAPLSVNRS